VWIQDHVLRWLNCELALKRTPEILRYDAKKSSMMAGLRHPDIGRLLRQKAKRSKAGGRSHPRSARQAAVEADRLERYVLVRTRTQETR
jgi:hypothetical protein